MGARKQHRKGAPSPERPYEAERRCLVCQKPKPKADLIRFVKAPDGRVIPDLDGNLPGRGAWVSARADQVSLAVRKKLFTRAFKESIIIPDDLDRQVAGLLQNRALGLLKMSAKAGLVTTGFEKVTATFRKERVFLLLIAKDAASASVRKITEIANRAETAEGFSIKQSFDSDQLSLALGRENVVQAALKEGGAAHKCAEWCDILAKFEGIDPVENPEIPPLQPKETAAEELPKKE